MQTFLRNPLVWAGLIGVFAVLAVLIGGLPGFFAAGGLASAVTFVIAAAFVILLARAVRSLSILVPDAYTEALANDPIARAVSVAGIYIACAILGAAVFG